MSQSLPSKMSVDWEWVYVPAEVMIGTCPDGTLLHKNNNSQDIKITFEI
jgi:hypothetical protein